MREKSFIPDEKFDWAIYVDATLAGLAILVPIPLLDLFLEWIFKRRMPQAIAKRNGRTLSSTTIRLLNRSTLSCLGCLLWPVELVWLLLKRTYRTIFYFLTVKEATDKLSYYWHRAHLLNYMVGRGDLDSEALAMPAVLALQQVLDGLTTSPLTQLAQQVVASVHHALRSIWRWLRRKQEDETLVNTRVQMANAWRDLSGYFALVREQYLQRLEQVQITRLAESLVVDDSRAETDVSPSTAQEGDLPHGSQNNE